VLTTQETKISIKVILVTVFNEKFGSVSKFKYQGTTVTNKNYVQDEIRRMASGNTYYYSVQEFINPVHFPKAEDQVIQIHDFVRFLYGCEIWSLTLKKHRIQISHDNT
jgi:hypothetical protein